MKMAYLCSDKLKTIGMHSIHHEILRLALPSIISNITVPLLGLVDLTIVGHLGSEVYIGAIAVGTMIFNVLYWLLGFLRMGNSGMTSQAFGRRDEQAVRTILVRSLLIAIGMGVLFIVLQRPLCDVALWVMHPSAEIAAAAHTYFAICIWSAPAMLALYALNGWFVGLQTTKVPMFIALFQNVVNILLSLGFVIVMHMKIEGVAWGTMLAQWAGALLAALLAYRKLRKQPLPQQCHKIALRWMDFFVVNRDIFFAHAILGGGQPVVHIVWCTQRRCCPLGQHVAADFLHPILVCHGWICLCRRSIVRQKFRCGQCSTLSNLCRATHEMGLGHGAALFDGLLPRWTLAAAITHQQ